MIKLIVTDVDGTLIPEGSSNPSPVIVDTMREIIANGVTVAIASGRSYESIIGVFPELKDEAIFISNNGACITKNDITLNMCEIERSLVEQIVKYVRSIPDSNILVTTEDYSYSESTDEEFINWIRNGYRINLRLVDDVLSINKPIVKLAMFLGSVDAAEASKEAVEYFGTDKLAIMGAGAHWVDFIRDDVDKGNAVASLQKDLGISCEETASFGDNLNDIGLIKSAGYGYAVANARDELKQAAYEILPDTPYAVIDKMREVVKQG